MAESASVDAFRAFGLLSHLYLTPVLVALIRGRVPDHLADGPLTASELATRAGLNALSVTRGLRALAAFGAFQEVAPGVFANTPVSELYRDHGGTLRNAALFWGDEHVLKSAAALGRAVRAESRHRHARHDDAALLRRGTSANG